jgi:Protein of unknown function (DUF1574)
MPTSMHELTTEQAPEQNTPEADASATRVHKTRERFRLALSYVLIACVGFVAIDLFNRFRPHDHVATPEKSAIWWAYKNWREQPRKPDVVLLGSSLMIAAQNDCDATFYDQTFDAVQHYHSEYLESKLSQEAHRPMTTASFVIGGQMATDAYAIIRTLLNSTDGGISNSETLVWGIAPRDFMDATFGRPEDTETVRLMSRISEKNDLLQMRKSNFWTRFDDLLNKICSLYANRNEFRELQRTLITGCLKAKSPDTKSQNTASPATSSPRTSSSETSSQDQKPPDWLLHQVSLTFPEDNRIGQWTVRPCKKKGNESRDNATEYKARYATFKQEQFAQQLAFYEKALDAAREGGNKILIVNMPLTTENMRLLPPGVYEQYLQKVTSLAKQHGAYFFDLNSPEIFSAKDFWDPVHLDGYGATRFMNMIAEKLESIREPKISQ